MLTKQPEMTTNAYTGRKSMKKSMVYYTWLWSVVVATSFFIFFFINPTELKMQAFTGASMLIGSVFSVAYAGFLVGEWTNGKDTAGVRPAAPSPVVPGFATPPNISAGNTTEEE
jgi:hypothetical protein